MACVTFWNGLDNFLIATFCCVIVSYAALEKETNKKIVIKKTIKLCSIEQVFIIKLMCVSFARNIAVFPLVFLHAMVRLNQFFSNFVSYISQPMSNEPKN